MNEIYIKFKELINKYNSLCFKIKKDDYFILGIMSNEGPIGYKFDIKYYDDFPVRKIYNCFDHIEWSTIKKIKNSV